MTAPPEVAPPRVDLDTLFDDRDEDEALTVVIAELRAAREKIAALEARERALVAGLEEAVAELRAKVDVSDGVVDESDLRDMERIDRLHALAHPGGAAPAVDLRGLVDALDDAAYEHGEALADTGEKYQAAKVVRREARNALLDRLRALGLAPAPTKEPA